MFDQILEQFKEKKHDLLDYNTNKFDRDFVEFNVRVGELGDVLAALHQPVL